MIKLPALVLPFLILGIVTGCSKKKETQAQNGGGDRTRQSGSEDKLFEVLELKLKQAIDKMQLKRVDAHKTLNKDRTDGGNVACTMRHLSDALYGHGTNEGGLGKGVKTFCETLINELGGKKDSKDIKESIRIADKDNKKMLSDDDSKKTGFHYDFAPKDFQDTGADYLALLPRTYADASTKAKVGDYDNAVCKFTEDTSGVITDPALARKHLYDTGLCINNARLLLVNFCRVFLERMEEVSKNMEPLKTVDKKIDNVDDEVAKILAPIIELADKDFVQIAEVQPSNNSENLLLCSPTETCEIIDLANSKDANSILKGLFDSTKLPKLRYSKNNGECLSLLADEYKFDVTKRNVARGPGSMVAVADLGTIVNSIFATGFGYPSEKSKLCVAMKKLKTDLEKEVKKLVEEYNKAVAKKPATQATNTPG